MPLQENNTDLCCIDSGKSKIGLAFSQFLVDAVKKQGRF